MEKEEIIEHIKYYKKEVCLHHNETIIEWYLEKITELENKLKNMG